MRGCSFPGPAARPRMALAVGAGALVAIAASGCGAGSAPGGDDWGREVRSTRLAAPGPAGRTLLARLEADETGLEFRNELPREKALKYLFVGAGVAAGDYDNDGAPDLYLVSEDGENKLYRNRGGWRFEDVTEAAGVRVDRQEHTGRWDRRYPVGATFLDANGDGFLDLFVTVFAGANVLFANNGDGTFTDVTAEAGLGYVGASTTATTADIDRDGDVDLFVATYRPYAASTKLGGGTDEGLMYDVEETIGGLRFRPERDLLYVNDGAGHFTEVGGEAGLVGADWGLAAMFADATGDGWPDLYVSNDFETPDRFYRNLGDGTFALMPNEALRHTPLFSMGLDFGDVNNDGRLDLITTDMLTPSRLRRQTESLEGVLNPGAKPPTDAPLQIMRNSLFVNRGQGMFEEVANYAGVSASEWTWSAKFADMDLDGRQDLLVTTGFVNESMNADLMAQMRRLLDANRTRDIHRLSLAQPRLITQNFAFRNAGGLRFTNESAAWGFADTAIAHGMALADLDGDGDLDVVVNNMNTPLGVYRNDATANRLAVSLQGRRSNRLALGARIQATAGGRTQTREMTTSGGYLSSHEAVAVFGLGRDEVVDRLVVAWPSGGRTDLADVPANTLLVVTEPADDGPAGAEEAAASPLFREVAAAAGARFLREESVADDYGTQPLLPMRLSRFGPPVAWGDADGDGLADLFVGGSRGRPGAFFHNRGDGGFEAAEVPAIDDGTEAMGALWWPRGGGGHDLMTGRSTVERRAASPAPVVRRRGMGSDPGDAVVLTEAWSAGPLAAADVNGDGFLDLFVGGRVQPGRYPLPVDSRLLLGGPRGLAPDLGQGDLANLGLVSGAVWTDADGDGDPDLVVATEWGPVRLLRNDSGHLVDATVAAGLADTTGRWNGVAAGDLDGNGSMDLVATNLGLNTPYRASPEEPLTLFAGDLDEDGELDLVEAEWDGGRLYPRRGRRELADALPYTWKLFDSYKAFAHATLKDILHDRLKQATRFEATTLAHMAFLNDGAGRFRGQPLPPRAQLAVGFGVALADFDGDGRLDVYIAGNFDGPEAIHMGAFDGSLGLMMRGGEGGALAPVRVADSGLAVPHDARGVAVADYDQDGWLDLAVGVSTGPLHLFHNMGVAGRRSLLLRLRGDGANPDAVGARITVALPRGEATVREVRAGGGFLSEDGAVQVIGVGAVEGDLTVTVRWPDGMEQRFEGVVPGALTELVQGATPPGGLN